MCGQADAEIAPELKCQLNEVLRMMEDKTVSDDSHKKFKLAKVVDQGDDVDVVSLPPTEKAEPWKNTCDYWRPSGRG
eukprot:2739985-Amphidinium_carterae.1